MAPLPVDLLVAPRQPEQEREIQHDGCDHQQAVPDVELPDMFHELVRIAQQQRLLAEQIQAGVIEQRQRGVRKQQYSRPFQAKPSRAYYFQRIEQQHDQEKVAYYQYERVRRTGTREVQVRISHERSRDTHRIDESPYRHNGCQHAPGTAVSPAQKEQERAAQANDGRHRLQYRQYIGVFGHSDAHQ